MIDSLFRRIGFGMALLLCLSANICANSESENGSNKDKSRITNLLVLAPISPNFLSAIEGLRSELGENYALDTLDLGSIKSSKKLGEGVRNSRAKAIVLMDNRSVVLAKELSKIDTTFAKLPKFVLMVLQADKALLGLPHVAGIRFEVPGYTVFTQFRNLSESKVTKVAVFHRKRFQESVLEEKRLLQKEKIVIQDYCLDCNDDKLKDQKLLDALQLAADEALKKGTDAFWMLPDNAIVNSKSLENFWIGSLKKKKKPIVVPLENLASLEMGMGIFSANPDYLQLGIQSAQQILQVLEEHESPDSIGLEPLISVQTVINLDVAKIIGWKFNTEKLSNVNKVLQSK